MGASIGQRKKKEIRSSAPRRQCGLTQQANALASRIAGWRGDAGSRRSAVTRGGFPCGRSGYLNQVGKGPLGGGREWPLWVLGPKFASCEELAKKKNCNALNAGMMLASFGMHDGPMGKPEAGGCVMRGGTRAARRHCVIVL
jgi:hypothetical protein